MALSLYIFLRISLTYLAISILCISLLYGQDKNTQDSTQIDTYHFITNKNANEKVEKYDLDNNSPYEFFTILLNKTKYKSLWPPKQISDSTFHFAYSLKNDSAINNSFKMDSLNEIEFQFKTGYQFGLASKYLVFSLLTSVLANTNEGNGIFYPLFLGSIYFMPAFTLGGILTSAAPISYNKDGREYFSSKRNWFWDLGFSIGKFNQRNHHLAKSPLENRNAMGIYVNLQRKYTPFSFAFRLHHVSLPTTYSYDPYTEETIKGGYDLYVSPSLKTTLIKSNRLKLNILTGFLTQMRYQSHKSDYYYDDDDIFWGQIEAELQYYFAVNLTMSISVASQYNFDKSRFPIFLGLMYSESYTYGESLKFDQISLATYFQRINFNYEYDWMQQYNEVFGLSILLSLSQLSELNYTLAIDLEEKKSEYYHEDTKISQTLKYSRYFNPISRIYIGMSLGLHIGEIYRESFEIITGPKIKINSSFGIAPYLSIEKGIIESIDSFSESPTIYEFGLQFKL